MTEIIILNKKNNYMESFVEKILKENDSLRILFLENLEDYNNFNQNIFLVYNYDKIDVEKLVKNIDCKKISFGFDDNADFKASDLNETNDSVNFKINYKGSFVPVWLPSNLDGRERAYAFLSAVCVSNILGINIIQTVNNFKNILV